MQDTSYLVPGTFTVGGQQFKVTKQTGFIILVKDLESGESLWLPNPVSAWVPAVQRMAKMHLDAWEYANCINVNKG